MDAMHARNKQRQGRRKDAALATFRPFIIFLSQALLWAMRVGFFRIGMCLKSSSRSITMTTAKHSVASDVDSPATPLK